MAQDQTGVNTSRCPHCGQPTPPGDFCQRCGMALPAAAPTRPRVVSAEAAPLTAAGQQAVGEDLGKLTRRAAYTLLAVGLLQITCGAIAIGLLTRSGNTPPSTATMLFVVQLLVAAIFIGLFFWARVSPLPASITGLVLYVTLVVLNVLNAVLSMREGGAPSGGFGGLGIGLLDIVIIVFLAQGIGAAAKRRRLLEQGVA